ncbi:unnamed protein product [Fraxinus pennsylvanica]|uniref:HR-like lesion-inducer n=1 Tax=Fraxinus pennsylvanica TaxID=56036 RepID=A0AAD2DXE8_9LAMI|nr:unnamed protein product [Fraxinus pennsylvanica]
MSTLATFNLHVSGRFNEFGIDGGPAAKSLRPKFNVFSKHVKTHTGLELPYVEMKHLILGAIIMKGFGSLLFIFGSSLGAVILLLHQLIAAPILYDFYNYDAEQKDYLLLGNSSLRLLCLCAMEYNVRNLACLRPGLAVLFVRWPLNIIVWSRHNRVFVSGMSGENYGVNQRCAKLCCIAIDTKRSTD